MIEATTEPAPTERAYERRLRRYVTAMDLGRPDRVPVHLGLGEVQATYAGIRKQDVFYDFERNLDAARYVAERLDLDMAPGSAGLYWAPLMDAVGAVYYRFPGRDLAPEGQFQFVEGEYMLPEDYEAFIAGPTEWILATYLPRIHREFRDPGSSRASLALIRGMAAAEKLARGSREFHDVLAKEYGLPPSASGKAYAPFDVLGDKLRGMRGILLDIHRRPDEVLRASDMLVDHVIHKIMSAGGPALPAQMPLHRGAYPFLSPKQWQTFYWPSLKKVIEGLWSLGKRTLFVAEADWTPYLEWIAELPRRSIVFHVDQTDLATAKRLFGGRFCLSGNVPNDLLAYATPGEVREYTKRLVGEHAGEGGFIVSPGAAVAEPARLENLEALLDAAHAEGGGPPPGDLPAEATAPSSGGGRARAAAPGGPSDPGGPGVCLPWAAVGPGLGEILGDEGLVRREWEDLDARAYAYLWSWIA